MYMPMQTLFGKVRRLYAGILARYEEYILHTG